MNVFIRNIVFVNIFVFILFKLSVDVFKWGVMLLKVNLCW